MLTNPNIKPRWQIYQLTIDTVPVGGVTDVSLDLDSDSGFALRRVTTRNLGSQGFRFRNANGTLTSPTFESARVAPVAPLVEPFPQRGGLRKNPEMIYPPNSTIRVDVQNDTAAPLSNVQIIFHGSKLFERRDNRPDFPARMAVLPFIQQTIIRDIPLVGSVEQIPMTVSQDCDFVFRGAVGDPFRLGVEGGPVRGAGLPPDGDGANPAFGSFTNMTCLVMDGDLKPYMNEAVHVNEVFGQNNPFPPISAGGQDDPAMWRPGLFTPQIYVERLHSLYVSVFRNDSTPGQGPIDFWIRWHGCKVYPVKGGSE